jgi:hypothetical protein
MSKWGLLLIYMTIDRYPWKIIGQLLRLKDLLSLLYFFLILDVMVLLCLKFPNAIAVIAFFYSQKVVSLIARFISACLHKMKILAQPFPTVDLPPITILCCAFRRLSWVSASLDGVDLLPRKAIAGREEKRERGWVGCFLLSSEPSALRCGVGSVWLVGSGVGFAPPR